MLTILFNVNTKHTQLKPRSSASPKQQELFMPSTSTKLNYPAECKPNINDLRQLFDDNSRAEHKRHSRQASQPTASHNYIDTKHISLDENMYEMKSTGGVGVVGVNMRHLHHHHQPHSMPGITTASNIPSARNIDFERAKQKFDKPITTGATAASSAIHQQSSSSSSSRNNKKSRNFSSFLKFNSRKTESPPPSEKAENDKQTTTKNQNNNNNNNNFDSNDFGKQNTIDKLILNDGLLNQKKEAYMNSSMNLDGLKVSEDDDDVSN